MTPTEAAQQEREEIVAWLDKMRGPRQQVLDSAIVAMMDDILNGAHKEK